MIHALLTTLWDVVAVVVIAGPAQFVCGHHRMH